MKSAPLRAEVDDGKPYPSASGAITPPLQCVDHFSRLCRRLTLRHDHQGPDGHIYQLMEFLFDDSGKQVFFSTGSGWSRKRPRPFPSVDDYGELLDG